jgi:hypothetical protein
LSKAIATSIFCAFFAPNFFAIFAWCGPWASSEILLETVFLLLPDLSGMIDSFDNESYAAFFDELTEDGGAEV